MSKQRMDQNWERMKGQILATWEGVDEAALKKARGKLPEVVTIIETHTGEPRAAILSKMSSFR